MSHIIVPLTPLTYLYTSDTRYERRLNHASPKPKARNEQVLSLVSSIGTAEEHPVLEATNEGEQVAAPMTSITSREVCLESTRLGLQLYAQGQQREALEAFDTALALDDTICLTWVGKGKVLLELQRFLEAQAAFEHAISVDPTNTDALHGKAQAHEALRREQIRQVAPGLDSALPLAIDGLGKGIQLIGHALAALLRHC